jgi:hypothetical protein
LVSLACLPAFQNGQAILWPDVAIPPSISLTDSSIDYTIGSKEITPMVADAVLNVPTPVDFSSATLTVELRDGNSSISSNLVHPEDPQVSADWTMEADLQASGVQTYVFTPNPKIHAGRQQFQALLRSIAYSYQQSAGTEQNAAALAESSSTHRTVTFMLSGIRSLNAEANSKDLKSISEQLEIRLLDESEEFIPDEVVPTAAKENVEPGEHTVALSAVAMNGR